MGGRELNRGANPAVHHMIEQGSLEIIGTELRLGEIDKVENTEGEQGDNSESNEPHRPAPIQNPLLESILITRWRFTLRHEARSRDKESGEH